MNTNDKTFQNAKLIKLQKEKPSIEFKELSDWIKNKWGAKLITGDILYYKQMSNPTRLRLVFDQTKDLVSLPKLWNERQDSIGLKFREILFQYKIFTYNDYDLTNLEVDYLIFEELAYLECIESIDLNKISNEYKKFNVWQLNRYWKEITVFYNTNEEVTTHKKSGLSEKIKNRIFEIAKEKDHFNILKNKIILIEFNSKENFDKIGSWYNFNR